VQLAEEVPIEPPERHTRGDEHLEVFPHPCPDRGVEKVLPVKVN
jgi:hypothetical protein